MKAQIADESLTIVFRSLGDQTGHIVDPHMMVGIVWSSDQKQVDVMRAVTLLAYIKRNETVLITKFRYVFYGQRKSKARNV